MRKKNGSHGFCVDLRQLNLRTIKDSYALSRIHEVFDQLDGASYFSTLHMPSGYYQVEIEKKHNQRTAFTVSPLGFYVCNRMAFGLTNAPATFQRLTEHCMGELHLKECTVFLADVMYECIFEEEMQRFEHVFSKVRQHNLKIHPVRFFFSTRSHFVDL